VVFFFCLFAFLRSGSALVFGVFFVLEELKEDIVNALDGLCLELYTQASH
jgi:hypothetical protein